MNILGISNNKHKCFSTFACNAMVFVKEQKLIIYLIIMSNGYNKQKGKVNLFLIFKKDYNKHHS